MFTTVIVQLPTHVLQAVIGRLRREGANQDISAAATVALQHWLAQDNTPAGADPARGYQWKSLFLPDGTMLRSWSYGENNLARVEGDRLMHNGRSVSPNQFAQSFARSTRNAWTDLYVRRPGDKRYTIAHVLRDQLAKQERVAAPTPPPQTAVPALAAPAPPSPPSPPAANAPAIAAARLIASRPGWDLPERRSKRYRIEDLDAD